MSEPKARKPTNTAAPFNVAWLIFFALLIFWPDTLTDIWEWDWESWQRILSVVAIALVWTSMMNGGQSRRRKKAVD